MEPRRAEPDSLPNLGAFGHPYGYGFLHEDINNSGDGKISAIRQIGRYAALTFDLIAGGIYAELIQNRAFQYSNAYPVSTDHYYPIGGAELEIVYSIPYLSDALHASMRVSGGNGSEVGFENEGYWGIDVKQQPYTGSFWTKGAYTGSFTASLRSNLTNSSAVFGSVQVASDSTSENWTEHTFILTPDQDAPNSNNTFAITFDAAGLGEEGYLDFNLISLFPPTYKNRTNGLRVDIAEALAGLNPSYIRFPGGNMLEGLTNDTYWDWKDTLGPIRERPGFQGVWE
jgi:alpha-L-arabinofuranosidase